MPFAHSCLLALIASVPQGTAPPQQATQEKPQAQVTTIDPKALPVSLDRIQQALAKTPMLRFDEQDRPVFRVQVFGDKPTIDDILGPDWARGPVKHGAMTHQEFLDLVTPKDVQGYAAFSNKEAATVAATSFLLQWTLQKAIRKYNERRMRVRARRRGRKSWTPSASSRRRAPRRACRPGDQWRGAEPVTPHVEDPLRQVVGQSGDEGLLERRVLRHLRRSPPV